ncbi:UNVERIFIED_CONTAM: Pentatricopeptide repeat-containing protein, mitochondrial [Sesamum radiatum]|uniref:Pentatricopeptide repeat-containing protein, mitochondrial n=1 Tax=Sesamum radiatum TaxID=300843 RepID=A0AAW2JSI5_SESRA
MAIRSFLRSLFSHPHNSTKIRKFLNVEHFSSHSIPIPSQQIISNLPSDHLVNELSRVLSDYRNPQHDIESALSPFASRLSTNLVEQVLKRKHVRHAQEFFDRVKGSDLSPTVKTYSILMRGWGDIGEPGGAQKLFDEVLERGCTVDLLAWNSVLDALCKGGKVDEAYELLRGMRHKGLEPDAYSYSIFIHASCDANDLHSAFRVLDSMKRYNLVPNVFTYNCIIKKLCKNDKVDEAYELLDEMIERGAKPDTWSYNSILAYHCDHNEVNKALKLISRMDRDACQPDRHTYNMVLKMLIGIGRFDRVEKVWYLMEVRGFYPAVSTYAVMIHGLFIFILEMVFCLPFAAPSVEVWLKSFCISCPIPYSQPQLAMAAGVIQTYDGVLPYGAVLLIWTER